MIEDRSPSTGLLYAIIGLFVGGMILSMVGHSLFVAPCQQPGPWRTTYDQDGHPYRTSLKEGCR
jgi:hypothetical protein